MANTTLKEYLQKGFVLDDDRLRNPDGSPDYFDELLARIRDIRASEKRFYQKIKDLFSLSSDYNSDDKKTQLLYIRNLMLNVSVRRLYVLTWMLWKNLNRRYH